MKRGCLIKRQPLCACNFYCMRIALQGAPSAPPSDMGAAESKYLPSSTPLRRIPSRSTTSAPRRMRCAIIGASSLSFLGLGVIPPAPEWGAMLSEGRNFVRGYPYITVFPGLAIMITVLALNMFGDGLRDAMDPKLRR